MDSGGNPPLRGEGCPGASTSLEARISLTSEQLEAARAERMRHNGLGALTIEDARTWIEETGLCLFLPRRQFSTSVAPSFVEAIAGQRDITPDERQIAAAEELLVRLETDGVAVRLNLLGQPGEQPDFVVATWVLPYVYALRGDRDWRRNPQLTGSRQVSQLAVQTYKLLEANDSTISQLKHALGREVSEAAVIRAITELWQQLRIIPVIAAPGQAAKWQLLRHRYQKAIAEGASTSQVTAISVLASIYLQAVIAASMEEVEIFLSPLTARSKVREVLRGLVATRQVHTISMGHAPHFYVAGTLPEFAPTPSIYSSSAYPASSYYLRKTEHEDHHVDAHVSQPPPFAPAAPIEAPKASEVHTPRTPVRKPAAASRPAAPRPHFGRPAPHSRDRKPVSGSRPASKTRPGQASNGSRLGRHAADTRSGASRTSNGARPAAGSRWSKSATNGANGKSNGSHTNSGSHASNGFKNGSRPNGSSVRPSVGNGSARNGKPPVSSWNKKPAAAKHNGNGHAKTIQSGGKPAAGARKTTLTRKDVRTDARPGRGNLKPALAAGAKAGNSKRFGFTARPSKGTKKRG
jgi:23S rRNA pseudouridine2605 synthase